MLAIAAITLLAVFVIPLFGLPSPEPPNDLGLTRPADAGAGDGSASQDGSGFRPPPRFGDAGDPEEAGVSEGGADESGEGGAPPPDGGKPVAQSEHLDDQNGNSGAESPMAVVVLDDDYAPPSQGFYLRQETWSQWNGTRMVRPSRGDVDGDVQDLFPTAETRVSDPPPENGRTRVHALVALLVTHTHPFALESPVSFTPAQNPYPSRFVRAYRFESLAQSIPYKELFGRKPGNPAWSVEARAHYLTGPSDPRYAELARSIVARLPEARRDDPFAQAVAVKLYFDDHFTYSLKHKHAGVADPTADFLFGDRIGYCVHFAHSAVILFRALGLPARIGAGYRSEEDDRRGSSTILVRAADAHAWPEIYLEDLGWIILDITAKKTLDSPPPPTDPEMQRLLGEMARRMPPDPSNTGVDDGVSARSIVRLLLDYLACASVITLLGFYLVKLWRRIAPSISGATSLPRTGYRAVLDLLAEVGLARRFGETREAFARRVTPVSPTFAALSEMHVAAAFGDPAAPREARPELSRAAWNETMRAARAEIHRSAPGWRRLLGALDPASFVRSR
jgi:transglutaminase-like putative cysteine protease